MRLISTKILCTLRNSKNNTSNKAKGNFIFLTKKKLWKAHSLFFSTEIYVGLFCFWIISS
jgi:hypothetical protein